MVSGVKSEGGAADLQASQAVFCFRGGGKVFASSCMWFCADWEGKAKAGGSRGHQSGERKEKISYLGCEGENCGTALLGRRTDGRVRKR